MAIDYKHNQHKINKHLHVSIAVKTSDTELGSTQA